MWLRAQAGPMGRGVGRQGGSVGEGECWLWGNHDCHTGRCQPQTPSQGFLPAFSSPETH